jgi:asparagine synthase (glutamine-hydrolysing)
LNRAAYLEIEVLLASYLLGSQGDRMAMAHGVEARLPFLDHRLFEFAAALPGGSKLCGLREKEILRRWADGLVPAAVRNRPKQPYRAPDIPAFFAQEPEYLREILDARALESTGLFDPALVSSLVARCRAGRATSVREGQALVGIISAQLWHAAFFERSMPATELPQADVALVEARNDTSDNLTPMGVQ